MSAEVGAQINDPSNNKASILSYHGVLGVIK